MLQKLRPTTIVNFGISRSIILNIALVLTLANAVQAANVIQIENSLPGTPYWRQKKHSLNGEIQAYADKVSVARGESLNFYVDCQDPTATIAIYRVGWYNGLGGRLMSPPTTFRAGRQNRTPITGSRGLYDCNWVANTSFTVPYSTDTSKWPSGIYFANLTCGTTGYQTSVAFVVRDDYRPSSFIFQQSVNTYQAYNSFGGLSLYPNKLHLNAQAVSFNRPYNTGYGTGFFLNWEINMVRFLEREGYDVTYTTDVDSHTGNSYLAQHKGFLIVGHDEYWTQGMRQRIVNLRNQRVGIGVFASDTCEWQARYEADTKGYANRTLVCYKNQYHQDPDYIAGQAGNAAARNQVTTAWSDPYLNLPEDQLFGVRWHANPVYGDIILTNTNTWVTEGSGATYGTRLVGLLGYETDAVNKGTPNGTFVLSQSPDRTGFSNMTLSPTPGGGFVFAVGSMQWSWGLDSFTGITNPGTPTSPVAQQITRNVLAHMLAL